MVKPPGSRPAVEGCLLEMIRVVTHGVTPHRITTVLSSETLQLRAMAETGPAHENTLQCKALSSLIMLTKKRGTTAKASGPIK
jgi:hypothetical protein